jgi:acyl-CoA reductase-like NAD-dependent aldehyde dehydrogenase
MFNMSKDSTGTQSRSFLLAGSWREETPYLVRCPYDGEPLASVHRASCDDLENAISSAESAFTIHPWGGLAA